MYSPKISDGLIPVLYRAAKAQSVPMTRLVDRLLFQALSVEPMSPSAYEAFLPYQLAAGMAFGFRPLRSTIGIEELLSREQPHAFRHRCEIEAWHRTSLHGVCRALELARQTGENLPADYGEFLRLLDTIRADAVDHLMRETAGAESAISR